MVAQKFSRKTSTVRFSLFFFVSTMTLFFTSMTMMFCPSFLNIIFNFSDRNNNDNIVPSLLHRFSLFLASNPQNEAIGEDEAAIFTTSRFLFIQ